MRQKVVYWLSMLTILVALLLLVYVAYYTYYPFNVIEINNLPYPVLNANKQVRAGDSLVFQADFCKNMSVPTETHTQFVDDILFSLPSRSSAGSGVGCHDISVVVSVPENLPPGHYMYRIVADHKIHTVLRTERIVAETEGFEVIE